MAGSVAGERPTSDGRSVDSTEYEGFSGWRYGDGARRSPPPTRHAKVLVTSLNPMLGAAGRGRQGSCASLLSLRHPKAGQRSATIEPGRRARHGRSGSRWLQSGQCRGGPTDQALEHLRALAVKRVTAELFVHRLKAAIEMRASLASTPISMGTLGCLGAPPAGPHASCSAVHLCSIDHGADSGCW
jgi:hypothetical protein